MNNRKQKYTTPIVSVLGKLASVTQSGGSKSNDGVQTKQGIKPGN